jgi:hypothetical protein
MKYFFILLLSFCAFNANAQKVYAVQYQNQADVKVFVVNYENQADVKVYFVDYENQAGWKNSSKSHFFY